MGLELAMSSLTIGWLVSDGFGIVVLGVGRRRMEDIPW